MKIKKVNQHFAFIDDLIRRKATGTPEIFGKKLGITGWQVKRIIRTLKEDGFPIAYCRNTENYYYTEAVSIFFQIKVGEVDVLTIKGGTSLMSPNNTIDLNESLTPNGIFCP